MKNTKSLIVFVLIFVLIVAVYLSNNVNDAEKISASDYNIILISLTNVGANHLGLYGYERNTSPNIDAFAEESIVFDNFFGHASWTLPSGMSLFTSLYPYQHKVMNRYYEHDRTPIQTLSPDIVTMIDVLNDGGYRTAAFTGGFDYRPIFGLSNRFNFYTDSKETDPLKDLVDTKFLEERRFGHMAEVMPDALEWIEQNKANKFFLFLQGYETHCPFSPKPPYDKRFVASTTEDIKVNPAYCYRGFHNDGTYVSFTTILVNRTLQRVFSQLNLSKKDIDFLEAQYDAEVKQVDDTIGDFMDQLLTKGILDNTIIILLSEHGEMFAKHKRFGRAGTIRGTLYDDVIHIPLIIRHPDVGPRRIGELAQMIDTMPTILEFVELPIPKSVQGKSLIPLIYNNKTINKNIYGGSVYGRPGFEYYEAKTTNEFVRTKDFKLIHEIIIFLNGTSEEKYELYDISMDKEEQNNIVDKEIEIADALKNKLANWSKNIKSDER